MGWKESDERIRQLMEQAGLPNSMALYQAFERFETELRARDVGQNEGENER